MTTKKYFLCLAMGHSASPLRPSHFTLVICKLLFFHSSNLSITNSIRIGLLSNQTVHCELFFSNSFSSLSSYWMRIFLEKTVLLKPLSNKSPLNWQQQQMKPSIWRLPISCQMDTLCFIFYTHWMYLETNISMLMRIDGRWQSRLIAYLVII